MNAVPRPDHSERPNSFTCSQIINAKPATVFAAFSTEFDRWFAQPGTLVMTPEPGQPYFFYNRDEWGRHPHYGRILEIKTDELIEMTWMTGNGTEVGTQGAETILRIELAPKDDGTEVVLTHSGFVNQKSCDDHGENWPLALEILEQTLRS